MKAYLLLACLAFFGLQQFSLAVECESGVNYPIAYPTNCTKYIACTDGQIEVLSCQDDFHFNAEFQICDFPESAGCVASTTGSPTTTEAAISSTTLLFSSTTWSSSSSAETPSSALTTGSPTTTEAAISSTTLPSSSTILLSSSTTWTSSSNVETELPSTSWTTSSQSSELPTTLTSPTKPTTNGGVSTTSIPPTIVTGDFRCADGVQYLPHPSDCTKFYECSNNIPFLMQCPHDLHFHPTLNICVFPHLSNCENL